MIYNDYKGVFMQISLSKELQEFVSAYSIQHNISQNQIIEEAVRRLIEDVEDAEIAKEAYQDFLDSGKKTIVAKDLFEELGL